VDPLTLLDVHNLTLLRGERLVQRDLSFRVAAGGMLSILGRNGAGKTSVLRAVAGLLEPQSGSIIWRLPAGRTVSSAEERGQFVGWLGHKDGVKSQLTACENLRFHLNYYRRGGDIDDTLASTGLSHMRDLPAQYLSAGERRRLAFARLILSQRPLWLLDEPLSTLDRQGKDLVRVAMGRHCSNGGIVLAATHEPLGDSGEILELS